MSDKFVHKSYGVPEEFSKEKLLESLARAHVEPNVQNEIVDEIVATLPHHTSTARIRQAVKEVLARRNRGALARYSLKEAIMRLGPSGFPFERYIAYLWEAQGFKTMVDQTFRGRCVTHEVDVVVEKDNALQLMECKYHNKRGVKSDVKVALYVAARFADIGDVWGVEGKTFSGGWLVTNTKLTEDARLYAQCQGLSIMSWNYPEGKGLRDLVTGSCLYPITSLTSLQQSLLQELLGRGIVVCQQLVKSSPKALAGLDIAQITAAQAEAALICHME